MAVDFDNLRNLAEMLRSKTKASNKSGRSWYRFTNLANTKAEIYVYDCIGEYGVTAQDFVGELRASNASEIDLHINSEGGQVFDGLAIYESIKQHPATVTAYVDGLAASAASFIVQAADRRVMAKNAQMMIHDAHGLSIGNAADMREMADLLDKFSDNLAEIYAERAGGTRAQWRKAMRGAGAAADGTWYNAQEAVKAGLADDIAGTPAKETASPDNKVEQPTLDVDADFVRNALMEAFK